MKRCCHPLATYFPALHRGWAALAGCVGYGGCRVYLPRRGGHLDALREGRGCYEPDVAGVLVDLLELRPGNVFDVGGNVGFHSVLALNHCPAASVYTFEPSPRVLPYLQRTQAEAYCRDRWHVVPKALSVAAGSADFYSAGPAASAFDGLRPTGRVAGQRRGGAPVAVSTVDAEWLAFGKPDVSVIKIDTEGGEYDVLTGAAECVDVCRPAIVMEWNRHNIVAYGRTPADLFALAAARAYRVLAIPGCRAIVSAAHLALVMQHTENFALLPS